MFFDKAKSKDSRASLNHLKSVRYWHRPAGGLNEVILHMQEKRITNPTSLKKEHLELFIGSCLGMALEQGLNDIFWVARPESDPPDMLFMTMVSYENGGIKFHSREVEITRHMHNGSSLYNTIIKKDKAYPEDYVLVCFVETDGVVDFRELAESLKNKLTHISHVFLLFHGVMSTEIEKYVSKSGILSVGYIYSVVQLSPQFNHQTIDILKCWEQGRKDNKKLVYSNGTQVYYGLRKGDVDYPKIILP